MLSRSTLKFLKDLKANNNRPWFMENKPRYEEAKLEFEGFIDTLITKIAKFDDGVGHLDAKDCVFRIYRDVRFSKDKSPYKTHFGAHITPASRKTDIHSRAGYYIHLGHGESMLAGGAYRPEGSWLKAIRASIDRDPKPLKKILNSKSFKTHFGEMEGEQLKKAPKDYPADHPEIELLRYKSFLAVHQLKDKDVAAKDFLAHCTKVFKALRPFDDFLNQAV